MDDEFSDKNMRLKRGDFFSSSPLKNAKFGRTHSVSMAHKDDVEV